MPIDRYYEIQSQLNRIEDKLDKRLGIAEDRIDELEINEAGRKGALKMFVTMIGFLGTITGLFGSYVYTLVSGK